MTFEAYWNELLQQDEIKSSESLLSKIAKQLDKGTTKHSRRTAVGVAMATYLGSVEHDLATPLVAAAHVHDLGKHACQEIITASYVDFRQPFNKHKQRRHPHDGFVIVKRHVQHTALSDLAATHVLTHHTHKNAEDSNYPTPAILSLYVDVGDITQRHLDVARQTGPILAHSDLIDAMSHPAERPYMASDEVLMSMTYPELVDNAVRVANRDISLMPFGIAPQHIGAMLVAHQTLVDAYSAP